MIHLPTRQIMFISLPVILTLTHHSDIVYDIPSGYIYIWHISISRSRYIYIPIYIHIFWHSIWHSFRQMLWHSIGIYSDIPFWHIFWHSFWHSIWHLLWHSIWHSIWPPLWYSLCHEFGPRRASHQCWRFGVRVQAPSTAAWARYIHIPVTTSWRQDKAERRLRWGQQGAGGGEGGRRSCTFVKI